MTSYGLAAVAAIFYALLTATAVRAQETEPSMPGPSFGAGGSTGGEMRFASPDRDASSAEGSMVPLPRGGVIQMPGADSSFGSHPARPSMEGFGSPQEKSDDLGTGSKGRFGY